MMLRKNCLQIVVIVVVVFVAVFGCCGCTAIPRIQLSAADSMELLAASLATAINEYRNDLEQLDAQRRKAVVDAFVTRVRSDHQDEYLLAGHSIAFHEALDRIEADQRAASDRRQAAIENLETLKEIADGLRRVAFDSMNLDDEASRYLAGLFSHIRTNQPQASGEHRDLRP